ncbi:hypothetical protein KQX54_006364 [Cotesia glomerata]|uniref:Uncharacterized protein n=1 Tax=Cotesia glomerata TaxID=32391 RepID=A0AAV7IA66_COTGL|nr:hypothetical protein KQX54_006364 [Cotesia glomerata]
MIILLSPEYRLSMSIAKIPSLGTVRFIQIGRVSLFLAVMRLSKEKTSVLAEFVQILEPSVQMNGEFNFWDYQQSTLDKIQEFVDRVFKETPHEVLSKEELKKKLQEDQENLNAIQAFMPNCFLFQDDNKNSSGSSSDSDTNSSDSDSSNSSSSDSDSSSSSSSDSDSSSSSSSSEEEEEDKKIQTDSGICSGTSPNNATTNQVEESLIRLSNNLYRCSLSKVGIKITIKKIQPFPKKLSDSNDSGVKRKASSLGVQERIFKQFNRYKRQK